VLSDWVRSKTRWLVVPLVRWLGKMGVSPNALTLLGFLLNVAVGVIAGLGHLRLAGLCAIISYSFDGLDGALARETGQTSAFGGFLDSVTDRISEAALFGGILWHAMQQGDQMNVALGYAAIIGSLLVSYARARAEGAGIDCKVGLFTRFERVAVLIAGLILGQLRIALWLLAILANVTVVQRMVHVWRVSLEKKAA